MFAIFNNRTKRVNNHLRELILNNRVDTIRKMNNGQKQNNKTVTFCDTTDIYMDNSVSQDTSNIFFDIVCFLSVSTVSYCLYISS